MVISIKIVFGVILLMKSVLTANILFIAPVASPSHYLWNKAFSLALVERGHNVTILTHDTEKKEIPKDFTVITMEGFYEILHDSFDFEAAMHETVLSTLISLYEDYVKFCCEHDLKTKGLDTLINYPKDFKFDLIIYDVTFGQCLYPLIDRFNNPPVVAVTAFLLPPFLSHAFGNHIYTSYMPYFNTIFNNKMNLFERVQNFFYIYVDIFYRNYISASTEYELGKKRFGNKIRKPHEVERSMSILLANTDPILDHPIALPPNIIPVGGLHINPAKTLPKEIQLIMDKAKHGVILFSLGTNIKFDMLKQQQKDALIKALGRFSQTVLWKIEVDNIKGLPINVVVRKWLPQNEILAHPNIRLFISHGGALSTQEAMYHGVPVVSIPFIMDQYINSRKLVQRKLATYLDHQNLTADNVYEAIKEVLDNPMYHQNVKAISARYRDQPQTPLERGIFWTEYILRHGTAEHLVLPARDMPFYQTSNLDILAVFVFVIILIYQLILLIITGCRSIFKFRKCSTTKSKKSN